MQQSSCISLIPEFVSPDLKLYFTLCAHFQKAWVPDSIINGRLETANKGQWDCYDWQANTKESGDGIKKRTQNRFLPLPSPPAEEFKSRSAVMACYRYKLPHIPFSSP